MALLKIIAGGQSGVDRAALDVAIELGIPYGGWCPRGGWAEDFPDPPGLLARYPHLRETPSAAPAQRTEWNVRDSDGVVIIIGGNAPSRGTALARELAQRYGKPLLVIDLDESETAARAGRWLEGLVKAQPADRVFALGIGGPRESEAPGIYQCTVEFLRAALRAAKK